jgi:hypothetical protein
MSTQPNTYRAYLPVDNADYVVLGPDGSFLKVPKELYDALAIFVGKQPCKAGQVIVHCNRGNVATVEVTFKLK